MEITLYKDNKNVFEYTINKKDLGKLMFLVGLPIATRVMIEVLVKGSITVYMAYETFKALSFWI